MSEQPERVFFSGGTLEQAVMAAARHYDCDPDEVLYERVEKRHGFLRTPRGVVIRVDPQNYRRAVPVESSLPSPEDQLAAMDRRSQRVEEGAPSGSDGERPLEQRPKARERRPRGHDGRERPGRRADVPIPPLPLPRTPPPALRERLAEATGPDATAARGGLEALFALAGLELEADVCQGEGRLEIDVGGADEEELQQGEGQLLRAFQHLLPRMVQAAVGELVPCRVDSAEYQEAREEQLRGLAQQLADEVRRDREPKTLRPLSPADRRIVHLALADDPEVVTESHGDGYYKRVTLRVS